MPAGVLLEPVVVAALRAGDCTWQARPRIFGLCTTPRLSSRPAVAGLPRTQVAVRSAERPARLHEFFRAVA